MGPFAERVEVRILVRLALGLWLVAALAGVWHVMAQQAPDSPLHMGILAGPIGQLRDQSFALGAGAFASGVLWPWLYAQRHGRVTLGLLVIGAVWSVVVLGYAAHRGMLGVQLYDPRPDAQRLVYARAIGHAITSLGLLALFVRALLTGRGAAPRSEAR
jgi:NhaP-type Na+/H+ or K+/H+ antiporter